ncbi:MAG: hypothetical protein KGH71_02310 [Candidatus Micrarchaeota archaeon]|nr:hypothetical protein [Candidatus Micrarchaeota archaeon]
MSIPLATLFFHIVAILSGSFLIVLTDLGMIRSLFPKFAYDPSTPLSESIKPFLLLFGFSTLFYLLFR